MAEQLYNSEVEQILICSLMHNNAGMEKLSDFLKPHHFGEEIHREIFRVIQEFTDRDNVADPVTLKNYFSKKPNGQGVVDYIVSLASNNTKIVDPYHYGKIINDFYLRRQLVDLGSQIIVNAQSLETGESAKEQIKLVEENICSLDDTFDHNKEVYTLKAAMKASVESAKIAYRKDRKLVGITSGFESLDYQLGGFHNSDLIILAGRPSMGKTALATNIAYNAAKAHMEHQPEGTSVLFFSLEMSAEQLATRILASESNICSERIRRGEMNSSEMERYIEASRNLDSMRLFIDDTAALSVSALRTRARRIARKHNIGMIIVDYLQLLNTGRHSGDNRVNEISEISMSLKALAKDLNVPVIALSQLSRAVETREDKRPQLSDLRESGSIEQDADVVLFVYREEYYLTRKEPSMDEVVKYTEWKSNITRVMNTAEVIIGKQRHGSIGKIRLHFDGKITKFSNLDKKNNFKYPLNFDE